MDTAEYERLSALYAERVAAQDVTHPGHRQRWERFVRALPLADGDLVVPPLEPEPHLDAITAGLRTWAGRGARLRKGAPNQCHTNAARLWLTEQADALVTGYARSGDGLWRQHSWALTAAGQVVETTVRRDAYAGVVLTDLEAIVFAFANVSEHAVAAAVTAGGRAGVTARMLVETGGSGA